MLLRGAGSEVRHDVAYPIDRAQPPSPAHTKRRRTGSTLPGIAPSNVYPCSDGEYLIGANQDGVFARLAEAMGQPELASDARYATHRARGLHQEELDDLIAQWTATLTIEQLEA